MAEYLIEPRAAKTGVRIGQPIANYESATIVSRNNNPGTFQLVGDWDYIVHCMGGLPLEGKGLLVTGSGVEEMSCRLRNVDRSGDGTVTMTFDDDTVMLWDRFIRPDALKSIDKQIHQYDTRSGTAEDVIRALVSVNLGPGAWTGNGDAGLNRRTLLPFVIPDSQGRGPTITIRAGRDKKLGDVVAEIANRANLRVRIVLREDASGAPFWQLLIESTYDKSGEVRFGPVEGGAPGRVNEDWTYSLKAPEVTTGILGGGGSGDTKVYFEDSLEGMTQDLWGYHIEGYVDAQDLDDLEGLTDRDKLDEKLATSITWTGIDINRIVQIQGMLINVKKGLQGTGDIAPVAGLFGSASVQYEALDKDTDITQDLIGEAVDLAVSAARGDTQATVYVNSLKNLQASYVSAWDDSSDIRQAMRAIANILDNQTPDRAAAASQIDPIVNMLEADRVRIITYNGSVGITRGQLSTRTAQINADRIQANNELMYNEVQNALGETQASTEAKATVIDNANFLYRIAWNVGDRIAWSIDGYDAIDVVQEVQIDLSADGLYEQVKPAIGPIGTTSSDDPSVIIAQTVTGIVRGVRSLQQR